jgi:hypothetical protein
MYASIASSSSGGVGAVLDGDALARRSACVVSKGRGGRSLVRARTLLWHPAQSLWSTLAWCGM